MRNWRSGVFLGITLALLLATPARMAASDTYGKGVSLTETTPISRLLERPAEFEGKTVRIEGIVKAVCTEMGCWMALAPTDRPDSATVLLKVEDGVIRFPVSAKGRRATAQGVMERVGAQDAEGQAAAAEHAHVEKRSEPPAATHWQIKATGAIIYDLGDASR
jgi:hypothetical protein